MCNAAVRLRLPILLMPLAASCYLPQAAACYLLLKPTTAVAISPHFRAYILVVVVDELKAGLAAIGIDPSDKANVKNFLK